MFYRKSDTYLSTSSLIQPLPQWYAPVSKKLKNDYLASSHSDASGKVTARQIYFSSPKTTIDLENKEVDKFTPMNKSKAFGSKNSFSRYKLVQVQAKSKPYVISDL